MLQFQAADGSLFRRLRNQAKIQFDHFQWINLICCVQYLHVSTHSFFQINFRTRLSSWKSEFLFCGLLLGVGRYFFHLLPWWNIAELMGGGGGGYRVRNGSTMYTTTRPPHRSILIFFLFNLHNSIFLSFSNTSTCSQDVCEYRLCRRWWPCPPPVYFNRRCCLWYQTNLWKSTITWFVFFH